MTSIASAASLAARRLVAATAATAWPSYSTLSRAIRLSVMLRSGSSAGRSGKSAPQMMARTPGIAAATEVSIEMIRAWAWGERRMCPYSIPGSTRSAAKRALPTTLSRPS